MSSRLANRAIRLQPTTSRAFIPGTQSSCSASWLRRSFSTTPVHNKLAKPQPQTITQKRNYSAIVDDATLANLPNLDPTKLEVSNVVTPSELVPREQLVFGRTFTDHMLAIEWTASEGWFAPRITPYQNLSLDPATCVFHYAFECFEGMKAYRDKQGRIRLFRPDKNMERLNKSAKRIALPTFDAEKFQELVARFCQIESRFIPSERGYSLYLRPTMIGTQRSIGVGPPGSALLYVIACPVGPYYPIGFKAISLMASSTAVRAWPGGVGDKKLGANYAPCIVPQMEAASKGFHQNLWLFNDKSSGEDYVTEVGTMNLFAALQHRDGTRELVTAPLDGTILEGVTRDSILELARSRLQPQGWKVSERMFTMREIVEAADEKRLLEIFGAGTAAIVAPVRNISYQGRMVDCGLGPDQEAGELATKLKGWIEDIQYGEEENHPWSVVVA